MRLEDFPWIGENAVVVVDYDGAVVEEGSVVVVAVVGTYSNEIWKDEDVVGERKKNCSWWGLL
jgi:hypothetical protein